MLKKLFGFPIMTIALCVAAYVFRKPLLEKLKGLTGNKKVSDVTIKPKV